MKGIRFYRERTRHRSCIAVLHANGIFGSRHNNIPCYEAIASVYFLPNSMPAVTSISLSYLRDNCRRISEAEARRIHPNLFTMLPKEA